VTPDITERDRRWAQRCIDCVLCKRARVRQRGFSYWFVKCIDSRICPFCKAYEKVYGRKAHESSPAGGK
jgi:hypothetical protein